MRLFGFVRYMGAMRVRWFCVRVSSCMRVRVRVFMCACLYICVRVIYLCACVGARVCALQVYERERACMYIRACMSIKGAYLFRDRSGESCVHECLRA